MFFNSDYMGKIRIGKVAITTHGKYDESKTYPQLGVVTDNFGMRCYMSIVSNNRGNRLDDATKWFLMIDTSMVIDIADRNTKKLVIKKTASDTSVEIGSSRMYEFPEMANLAITFESPVAGELNEYQFSFNSGASPTVLSLPANIVWASAVSIVANMHYEVNVVYNESAQKYYGMMIGWAR